MQNSRDRNLKNREFIHAELRREVVGPDPRGEPVDTVPSLMSDDDYRSKFASLTQANGEEVLRESPSRRYGVGVLHPRELASTAGDGSADAVSEEAARMLSVPDSDADQAAQQGNGPQRQVRERGYGTEGDDDSLMLANSFKPSALGLSFVVNLDASGADAGIEVYVANRWRTSRDAWRDESCGWYREHKLKVGGQGPVRERVWWLRTALKDKQGNPPSHLIERNDLRNKPFGRIPVGVEGFAGSLAIRWTSRRWPSGGEHQRIVTVTLVNEGGDVQVGADRSSLFQSGLIISAGIGLLGDYPKEQITSDAQRDPMDEEFRNRVIYSKRRVRAVGHGCGADWGSEVGGRESLWTDVMPAWEVPPMAFDVRTSDGEPLRLPMRTFAELDAEGNLGDEAFGLLDSLLGAYRAWIGGLDPSTFPADLNATAEGLKSRCVDALRRMDEGVQLLKNRREGAVAKAFALANRAMLMAQHQRPELRKVEKRQGQDTFTWMPAYSRVDLNSEFIKRREESTERPIGHWRPFQLAFLLMSLAGTVHPDDEDRKTVDLIWFPTGGGKTEAYLGLTAFTVFHGLLNGDIEKNEAANRSVSVLMRYTLRLLTSQQFERAVRLFCSMELTRSQDPDGLGKLPLTVGLWVGAGSTPNQVTGGQGSAAAALNAMCQGNQGAINPFVLLQCPWCGAPFGRVGHNVVHGYRIVGGGNNQTFRYACSDPSCEFGPGSGRILPAQVVDECLYREPPTLLIGTVDKFAMLAWKPAVRCFFGIGSDGKRVSNGPALIIQDEMHLITGPLGTMVGLYETVVEALCNHDGGILPKIIASTATAARAEEQVRGLFAREALSVFPPPGLDASDSFFAREDDSRPGRLYVGVMAPGHGSMQTTQRRVYAALMQAAADIASEAAKNKLDPAKEADPWWTLLAYYNSLRELGGALTLFGADIPDQLDVLVKRRGLASQLGRKVYLDGRVMELTSRLQSGDVPESLRSLERPLEKFRSEDLGFTCRAMYGPMDACLASNIIEVGVDVPRLSLMAIVGQPKTTSSYIQASSRVGRREDRPGLVVMQYSPTKPRDRSHYERFRAYHQALYAWVEPTSVTPFSPPVVSRALHAVFVAWMRQTLEKDLNAQDILSRLDEDFTAHLELMVKKRAGIVARSDELDYALRQMDRRLGEWKAYSPERFGSAYMSGEESASLLYPAGSTKPPIWGKVGWATPTSLRAVDSLCEAAVSQYYAELAANHPGVI